MKHGPNYLKKTLLEDASTEDKKAFAKMLADQCAEADLRAKGHKCWTWVPNRKEYEMMAKYAEKDECPKCGSGRIVLEIFKGDIAGDSYWLKCYWSKKEGGCDFAESANDDDREF